MYKIEILDIYFMFFIGFGEENWIRDLDVKIKKYKIIKR